MKIKSFSGYYRIECINCCLIDFTESDILVFDKRISEMIPITTWWSSLPAKEALEFCYFDSRANWTRSYVDCYVRCPRCDSQSLVGRMEISSNGAIAELLDSHSLEDLEKLGRVEKNFNEGEYDVTPVYNDDYE